MVGGVNWGSGFPMSWAVFVGRKSQLFVSFETCSWEKLGICHGVRDVPSGKVAIIGERMPALP